MKNKIKSDKEKSLEEVLEENDYSFTNQEFSNIINNIKTIKNLKHNDSAKEYFKQIILSGENIRDYLISNEISLKENHNNSLIKKLENLARKEKSQYDILMKPFVEEGIIEHDFTIIEKIKLELYDYSGNYKKYDKLRDASFNRGTLNSLKQAKEGLRNELTKAREIRNSYEIDLDMNKQKARFILQKLEKTRKDVELANKSLIKLKNRRDRLGKEIEESEEFTLDMDKDNEVNKLSEDIDRIQEESVDALESAEIDKLKVIDFRINIYEKNQLRTFYKDMTKSYVRHIDILSNLILKTEKGMSYSKAHELVKKFVQYDTPISKYMNIRKTELEKYNKEVLKINPPYVKEKISDINLKMNNQDYKTRMEEGAAELKEFLKDFKKY